MSAYGFDPESRSLSVAWATGRARRVKVATVLPDGVSVEGADRLVASLDRLSQAMWDAYVHPAWQFGDPEEVNTEAWRWGLERDAFGDALEAVRAPQLPSDGMLLVSYCRVEEGGNQVGRAVRALDLGPEFTALIAAEVQEEQAAIEAAEAGGLTGRAAQAVALSRIGASPTQVEVAWQALLADPLGCQEALLSDFDPGAAAIAAARCLRCAAEIAAEVSDIDWTDVVMEADDIEALPVMTPTTVLAMLAEGSSEREAVTALLLEAHAVAEGSLSGLGQLAAVVEQVQRLRDAGVGDEGLELRLTPLDPRRPAPDLLEDLLTGIEGCFLLWRESSDVLDDDGDEDVGSVAQGHAGGYDDEEEDDDGEDWYAEAAERFCQDLRQAMHEVGSPA